MEKLCSCWRTFWAKLSIFILGKAFCLFVFEQSIVIFLAKLMFLSYPLKLYFILKKVFSKKWDLGWCWKLITSWTSVFVVWNRWLPASLIQKFCFIQRLGVKLQLLLLFLCRFHVTSLTYSYFYSGLKIQKDWYRTNKWEVFPTVPHILLILALPRAKINCTKNCYEAWMLFSSTIASPWGLVRVALQFPFCKSELLWRREAHTMNFCERVAGSLPRDCMRETNKRMFSGPSNTSKWKLRAPNF